ncbi:MAG: hypothetical protein ACM3QS_10605 [Bacteroidota bacterium]
MKPILLLALAFLLPACSAAPTTALPQVRLDVYATPAAGPWLQEAFRCAREQGVVLGVALDPEQANLMLHIGEPPVLTTPAFEIDREQILIVTNRESPVQNLTLEQARNLFAGRGDPAAQVWVYAPTDDVQQAFDRLVMQGTGITSLARLATSPQEMSDTLNAEKNAVGILPRHWKAGTVREVFSAGAVPVLAITQAEPEGALKGLVACLQK